MKIKVLLFAVISLVGTTAWPQNVTPLYVESKTNHYVKGQFAITNLGLSSLPVSVEARQLVVVNGKATFQDVQPGTEIELKNTSAIIPPMGRHIFDYKVRCEKDCLITFLSGMVQGRTKEGIEIKIWLPSHVYLCQEQKGCRLRIKAAAGLP